jgi:hypothetical protein
VNKLKRSVKYDARCADNLGMSTSSINNLSSKFLQTILGTALQGTGLGNTTGAGAATALEQPDNGQLSPFAQLLNTLQQLQQSNPTQYQQVTQQVATNLTAAAKTATTDGNTQSAAQLTQLATDFTNASQTGQLPNIQDLAQATGAGGGGEVGGVGHHHHHGGGHHHAEAADTTTADTTNTTNTTSPLQQFLASLQANATPNESLNAFSIISNTLANAGITT